MRFALLMLLLLITQHSLAQLQSLPLVQQVMDHFNKGEYARVIPVAEKAVETTRSELGEQSPFHSGMMLFLGMSYWYLYDFPKAEVWMVRNHALTRKYNGERSPEYLAGLNRLAQLYRDMGRYGRADSLYQVSSAVAFSITGGKDTVYAKNLNNRASLYQFMGKYGEAEQQCIEALELMRKYAGEKSALYASSLNNLATLYTETGKYTKAKPLLRQVLDLRRSLFGEPHPDVAQSLNNLAYLLALQGAFDEAEINYTRSKDMYAATSGRQHPDYATAVNNLAELYMNKGDYYRAIGLYKEAREIRKQTLGENHPDYTSSLNNLATCFESMGLFDQAEVLMLEAKDRTFTAVGDQHPFYVSTLNNLAAHFQARGRYAEAEPMYRQALELRKKIYGDQHPMVALSLNNLGTLYLEIGQQNKAENFFQQSGDIFRKALGEDHYQYAMSLNNLAAAYEEARRFEKAETLYQKALEIRKKVYGEEHNEYAVSLNNLAALYATWGRFAAAENGILQANAIWKKVLPDDNPNIALGLNNLAAVYRKGRMKTANALLLYREALDRRKKVLGESHPLTADTENDMALLYSSLPEYRKAEPLLLSSSRKTMQYLQSVFPVLSEKEKENFIRNNLFFNDCNNSYLYHHADASPELINNNVNLQLFFKSLSLSDTRKLMEQLRNSRDTQLNRMTATWMETRSLLAAQYTQPAERRIPQLSALEAKAENLEKELGRRSPAFREQQSILRTGMRDLQMGLEKDEAAVEFVSFRLYDAGETDSILYAAYIIRKDQPNAFFVPLCTEKQLQDLISRAGRSPTLSAKHFYGFQQNKEPLWGDSLYQLLWKPLEQRLEGIKKIAYAPSGKLYGIAFHALPAGQNRLLMDQYLLRQFTSTRQVADRKPVSTDKPPAIVLLGNADFNMDSAAIARTAAPELQTDLAFRGGGDQWPELPFTARETDSIRRLFEENGLRARVYKREAAQERVIKQLSGHAPAVLHIATHGYYITEQQLERQNEAGSRSPQQNVYKLARDPMIRNGLILAGGNYTWAGRIPLMGVDDGVLTAYEIAQLDLSATRLVVLSACETALGDIQGGEGVYGLQRGFKLAGVDKMIVSLWQVPDQETAELMTLFYRHWLSGSSVAAAFAGAQSYMRRKYPPFYWAAFVLVE